MREALLSENSSKLSIRKTLVREIKQFGSTVLCIATALRTTSEVLSALRDEQMLTAGYAEIMVGEAVWEKQVQTIPGLLLLKEEDCVDARSMWQCDADLISAFITKASKQLNTPVGDLTREAFISYLQSGAPSLMPSYALVNTRNNTHLIVGRFDATDRKMNQTAGIYYPGDVATSPSGIEGVLEISINSGTTNPTVPPTSSLKDYYLGQQLAVQDLNHRKDILPHNTLISHDLSFGGTQWNQTWAASRILASRGKLGLVHMGGSSSVVVTNTMAEFARYNLSRPVMGTINSLIDLSNSTNYPWYLRNGISAFMFYGLYTNILPEIGWRRCAVLHGDDASGITMYETFKEFAKQRQIEILNNETLRKLPRYGSKETYWKEYRANLLELFRCNARVVLIFSVDSAPQYILELMFDLGARRGDFIFTGPWVTATILSSGTPLNVMKRKELLEGTLSLAGAAWIGSFGEEVKKGVISAFNQSDPSLFACFYYDSTLTIAYALQMCMQLGLDYTNPAQLMKIMRETRFTGCTGFISWLSGSNDRAYHDYSILNMVRDPDSGIFTLKEVGYYRPTSALLLEFTSPFIFPDGSSTVPSDLRVIFGNCPFEDKLMQDLPAGRHLAVGICLIIMGLTAILSVVIYLKLWQVKVTSIKRSELSVEDVIFMAIIGVEAAQIANMGPDLSGLNSIVREVAEKLTLDFSSTEFTNGGYWIMLNIAFGVVIFWVILNLFTCFRLEERCKKSSFCGFFGEIAYICLPQLGNICFIPIISTLTDVFICDKAVGYGSLSYTNSILAKDCYTFCWTQPHIIYLVFASLALLCYIPSAILLRPVWQDYQANLHIKTYPLFLIVKSVLQVALVCLSKTIKRWYPIPHSVLFLCVMTAFCLFSGVTKAHNYPRVNLWQTLSCVAVLKLSLIAILNDTTYNNPNFQLVFLVCILWLLLLGNFYPVFGLIFQAIRLPSALYRKQNRNIQMILRFAFTNTVSADLIQPRLNLARENEGFTGLSSQEFLDEERGISVRRVPAVRNVVINT